MILAEDRMNFASRLQFFTDVTALEFLCSPQAITRLESAVALLSKRDKRNFLRGYRLAVATPLHGLLWFVADHSELLGLEIDDNLFNWLHYRNTQRSESPLSAVSDPTSDLGRLCQLFNNVVVALRRSDTGLDATIAAIEECQTIATLFARVQTGTEIVPLNAEAELPNGESIVNMCLAERILDYLEYDPSIVSLAYELVWSGGEDSHPLHDLFILAADTHLSNVSSSLTRTRIPKEWQQGFWFGLGLVVQLNGIALQSLSDSDPDTWIVQDWFSELLAFVNTSHPEREWPSQAYGLTEFSRPNIRRLTKYLGMNMITASSKDKLAAILGPDTVRLITSAGPTDPLELEVILRGAVAMHGSSKVHLLLLTHSVASDEREWVSIALRVPIYGMFSNMSKWFLFYKIYHTGYVFDTDVARATTAVERLLLQFKDNLEVQELSGLDSEDFLPFCTLPAFRAMKELSHRSVETNADLRSGNSELLAALWLIGQGYRDVKVSFRRASLGKYEYDAIGVKDGQCLAMEVKGADISDHKLQEEMCRFANRVDHLRDRLPDLAKALGHESHIEGISGIFVFLGDLNNVKPIATSIPMWGYDDFVEALQALELPDKIVGLLDRSYIVRHVRLDEFPHDPYFVGLEADR